MSFLIPWLSFLPFAIGRIIQIKSPLWVSDDEVLAREIWYSKQFKKSTNRVNRSLFEPPKNSRKVSTTRSSYISRQLLRHIIRRHEVRRKKDCYGVAKIRALHVRGILSDVKGTPDFSNPFHADIVLPPDEGKDFVMEITVTLAEKSELEVFQD